MKIYPARGAKIGALNAILFAIIIPTNNLLRQEPVVIETVLIGAAFAFCVLGIIGAFTDKIGSDIGD